MRAEVLFDKKSWKEIRELIRNTNLEFFNIVENISPNETCPLYIINFPYGALIGDHVSQFLPLSNGDYLRLNDPCIPIELSKDLGYGKDNSPIGMILNKKIELYIDLPEKKMTLPFTVQSPGDFFSYNHILDISQNINYAPNDILYAISGGRSCFLLPSINCQNKFSRLCRALEIKIKRPISLYEHCNLFKQILSSSKLNQMWNSTIMYFSEAWVNNIRCNPKWYGLRQYFHEVYARRSLFPINATHYNTAYSLLLERKNFKPNPYIFDTFKHIIQIMCGHSPGLAPLIDEELLPLNSLQEVFRECYGLNEIFPTIIGPSYFTPFAVNAEPVYYSLQIPTTSSFSPKSKKASVMVELKELYELCSTLLAELRCDEGFCKSTIIQYVAKNIAVSYHHNSEDTDRLISLTDNIVNLDLRFGQNNKQFAAENGKFFRGCVKIYKKEEPIF